MDTRRRFGIAALLALALFLPAAQGVAAQTNAGARSDMPRMRSVTNAQRKAAAARLAAKREAPSLSSLAQGLSPFGLKALAIGPGSVPDYYGTTPNYANSPLPLRAGGAFATSTADVVPATGMRKFVDSLPGLGVGAANDLGQYIPVAKPDTTTYPGSDYYVIALVRYKEKLHADLPATDLQGYVQLNSSGTTTLTPPSYLGPTIVATKDRPVRVKFINKLPIGAGGNLFLPVDTTVMGAGMGPTGANYTQNRGTLHLHGGNTPWISDGTPHQWTTPAGESTPYPKGVSVRDVPGMPASGPGEMTFFYTNQQSARLMFYHDHSWGITRLNVYAGEAAPYLLTDSAEKELTQGNLATPVANRTIKANVQPSTVPTEQIPLVIQDKTFVPRTAQLQAEDPTWNTAKWGGFGNLWYPHVYMPNQNPADFSGVNPVGRWDYSFWFYPPLLGVKNGPLPNPYSSQAGEPPLIPGTPTPCIVPEAFMDTPLVNGTAYPYLKVGRKAYRFRILNASNDRSLNLQLYFAKSNGQMWGSTTASQTLLDGDAGEVPMVEAAPHSNIPTWPATWPKDGRDGGVPDPGAAGPSFIQIGTEGGLLPSATVIPAQPVGYEYNRRTVLVLNVSNHSLLLGPAERADVIVDFSNVPDGSKLIMYNDAPAPMPGFDSRYDYYTGDPDQTSIGGAPSTLPGYGPNTRTVMQFQVQSASAAPAYNLSALQTALKAAYAATMDKPIVPEQAYGSVFNTTYPNTYARVLDDTMTFTPTDSTRTVSMLMHEKAIIEGFDMDYGRMNAQLGVGLPNTGPTAGAAIPYDYVDPPVAEDYLTDTIPGTKIGSLKDGTQIWRIDHQGVDTHAIHFHLFNVQVINRVGIDGTLLPPDDNELGWKDTVRMNPGTNVIVALRPLSQNLPWKLPDSVRPINPSLPLNATWVDSAGTTIKNVMQDFGWEYVWHCHLLGHEENDMMRPILFQVAPTAPAGLSAAASALSVNQPSITVKWTNKATNPAATSITIERAINPGFTGTTKLLTGIAPTATTFKDTTTAIRTTYYYRVRSENAKGYSGWSATASAMTPGRLPTAPTSLHITGNTTTSIAIAWSLPATVMPRTGIRVQYSTNGGTTWTTKATLSGTATSYNITGLTHLRTYWIRVLSVGAYGTTASNVVSRKI